MGSATARILAARGAKVALFDVDEPSGHKVAGEIGGIFYRVNVSDETSVAAALAAAERLQRDTRLKGKLNFNGHEIEIVINDRVLAPNNEQTRESAEPEIKSFLDQLFATGSYSLAYPTERRRLFGVMATAASEFSIPELLANLGIH